MTYLQPANVTSRYLQFVSALVGIRLLTFLRNSEQSAQMKITKSAWEDTDKREIMRAHLLFTIMILFYRLLIVMWGSTLEDGQSKDGLCVINLFVDLMWLFMLTDTSDLIIGNKKKVMIHQKKQPELISQSLLVIAGVVTVFYQYF